MEYLFEISHCRHGFSSMNWVACFVSLNFVSHKIPISKSSFRGLSNFISQNLIQHYWVQYQSSEIFILHVYHSWRAGMGRKMGAMVPSALLITLNQAIDVNGRSIILKYSFSLLSLVEGLEGEYRVVWSHLLPLYL